MGSQSARVGERWVEVGVAFAVMIFWAFWAVISRGSFGRGPPAHPPPR